MTDKEFDWKEHFALCRSGDDFVALFKKVRRDRSSRKAYLNFLRRKDNIKAYEAVRKFKERRHDRRVALRMGTLKLNLKKKQSEVGKND